MKQENVWNDAKNATTLCDDDGAYYAMVFHAAIFDVVKYHGLSLIGLMHNEAQDRKTELDSSFFYFKFFSRL